MSKVYTSDVGTRLLLDTLFDISTGSAFAITWEDPNGLTGSWTATLSGTTKVQYITVAGNLGVAGLWKLQAFVIIGTGSWYGESVTLAVYELFA